MTKLRAVLAAAASLVIGGLSIGIALNQAGQSEGMTTAEWCAAIDKISDAQKLERFFVAIQDGATIPKAWPDTDSGRLLGDCAGGTCTIAPAASPECAYTYQYDCGPLRQGWRVCEVRAHPYIAKGWLLAANANPDLRWYGSLGQVVTECLVHFSGPDCLALLQADDKCWLLDDGGVCRYGSLLGSAEPDESATPCPYARVKARLPCVVNRGAGSEMTDAERVFEPEEMDQL